MSAFLQTTRILWLKTVFIISLAFHSKANFQYLFSHVEKQTHVTNFTEPELLTVQSRSLLDCSRKCLELSSCASLHFLRESQTCRLNRANCGNGGGGNGDGSQAVSLTELVIFVSKQDWCQGLQAQVGYGSAVTTGDMTTTTAAESTPSTYDATTTTTAAETTSSTDDVTTTTTTTETTPSTYAVTTATLIPTTMAGTTSSTDDVTTATTTTETTPSTYAVTTTTLIPTTMADTTSSTDVVTTPQPKVCVTTASNSKTLCYYVTPLTWDLALQVCVGAGGTLFRDNSSTSHSDLAVAFKYGYITSDEVYINAFRYAHGILWKESGGGSVAYTAWATGYPGSATNKARCAMVSKPHSLHWIHVRCSESHAFVCEK